jgi:CRISPR-associated endonuclease Cas2
MLVMLAYDLPETKDQTFVRKDFEKIGGTRVQYSIYIFKGEPHECERVIRYMRRVAAGLVGDIRLFPLEESTWDSQIVISEILENSKRIAALQEFVIVW